EVASHFTGRRGVSLPFSDFCQPLVFERLDRELFMNELVELGRQRKWRHFELRGGRNVLPDSAASPSQYYGHKLHLNAGLDNFFDSFQSSVRRAIRKAEKSQLAADVSGTWEAMADFYKLHVRTRRRHGLPPQPLSFFRNIHQEIIRAGLGFVVLAKRQLRP